MIARPRVVRFADRTCPCGSGLAVIAVAPGRAGISVQVRTTRGIAPMLIQSEIPDQHWCIECLRQRRNWAKPWLGDAAAGGVRRGLEVANSA